MAKAGEIQGPQRREKPLLLLMDGHALVYRAWHALQQPMTLRKTGEEVRAVYGFTSTFLKALQDWSPTHVAIAFDRPTPTFRHVQYEAYKAQRPEAPPELRQQFVRVRQLLEAFHIPIYERDGYEADDVLGALCRQASEQGMETLILTGDTDTLQLVSPLVKVLLYHRIQERMVFDEAQIAARYGGLTPHQHPHLKALQGDASDNIPGVPGVGEKTAVKLLQEFGSLQGIYENLDRVPQRLRETLASHREQVALGLELVTIVRDVPGIALDPDKTCFWRYDRREVVELLRELEFVSLVGRIPEGQAATGTGSTPTAPSDPSAPRELQYHTVARPEDLESLLSELANSPAFAFDLETTGKDPLRGELVGLAFATRPGRAFYVPVGHLSGAQLDRGEVLHRLQPLLEDPGLPKTAHNANFDMTVLGNLGIQVRGLACDTMLAAALLGYKNPGLKAMALERLGQEMTPISKLIGEGRKQGTMDRVAVADASAYACGDADMTLRLRAVLEPDLAREGMGNLFTQVEVPLVPVLVQMQTNGIALDVPTLRKMSRSLGEQLQRSEIQAYEAVGHLFNLNSPKQLSELLFGELRLEKTKRMKTGSYSTDAASLEALRGGHDVVPIILEYRQLSKLKSTYVDALPELVNPRTGRLHTSYNQAGAVTGRISSSEPNLQSIPIRTELG
ncbi:MAG: DNA polymerase I, partial [Chloroflexi bacterium]|nr:DNA polymerase I [Chloroflexota bacterium]